MFPEIDFYGEVALPQSQPQIALAIHPAEITKYMSSTIMLFFMSAGKPKLRRYRDLWHAMAMQCKQRLIWKPRAFQVDTCNMFYEICTRLRFPTFCLWWYYPILWIHMVYLPIVCMGMLHWRVCSSTSGVSIKDIEESNKCQTTPKHSKLRTVYIFLRINFSLILTLFADSHGRSALNHSYLRCLKSCGLTAGRHCKYHGNHAHSRGVGWIYGAILYTNR